MEQHLTIEGLEVQIAWELHNGVGNDLTGIGIIAQRIVDTSTDPEIRVLAEHIRGMVRSAEASVGTIRGGIIEWFGSVTDHIVWALREWNVVRPDIRFYAVNSGDDSVIGREQGTALIRILKEALANIVKYAEATEARVEFGVNDSIIQLEIEDDGVGLPPTWCIDSASGMRGIQNRARAWGGAAEFTSAPGQGTTIRVTMPVATPG